jgi:pyridoxamine 5'-phosphate oxidase
MNKSFEELRREYVSEGLDESDILPDPLNQFRKWFTEVINLKIDMANAMVVATADNSGTPSARYVLLKDYDENGFVFYTNNLSRKGSELKDRPNAALLFYWKELNRQVRIEGKVRVLDTDNADKYFNSRPRGSQISACIANQSEVIPDRIFMYDRVEQLNREYGGAEVKRPLSWIGYQVVPDLYEFWQGQENRLHDRLIYRRKDIQAWEILRLAP